MPPSLWAEIRSFAPRQADADFDGLGDACDSNGPIAVDQIEAESAIAIGLITSANPPGANGLISKLTGNGGVIPKVANAVVAFDGGFIDVDTYLSELNSALDKLGAFDNQLSAKIANGQIEEFDPTEITLASAAIRSIIESLIAAAA